MLPTDLKYKFFVLEFCGFPNYLDVGKGCKLPSVITTYYVAITNEFLAKQDVEKFLLCVQLKAYFHDKEDDSNTSSKDTFETLQIRKSKWTPPKGQFASLDFSSIYVVTILINLNSIVTPNFSQPSQIFR